MAGIKIDPDSINIRDEDWVLVEQTPDFRRYHAKYGEHPNGDPIIVQRTESLVGEALLAQNRQERDETDGTRWSSGAGTDKGGNMPIVKVSSIPLNVFYRDVAPRLQHGDNIEFMRWYLNQDETKAFRTRNGDF